MPKGPSGYKALPQEQIEVSTLHDTDVFLVGLGAVGELHGWKIFKKIKTLAKKIGKGIRKLKLKSVLAIALPVAGIVFAPLLLAKLPSLISKFGPKVGGLIKGGKTKAQAVRLANGAVKVGLVSPEELAKISKYTKDPGTPISEALFKQLTGEGIASRFIEGGEIKGGELKIPVVGSSTTVTGEDIPAQGKLPIVPLAIGAAVLLLLGKKR